MTDPIQAIIEGTNWWGGWGHQNSQLELASLTLEAKKAGFAYDRLASLWALQEKHTWKRLGVYRRAPLGEHSGDIANSHDNWIGIAVLSYFFDGGYVARQILDEGLVLGIWFTGKNEKGKWFDMEWFVRPENKAIMKLAAGRKITWIEDAALRLNIIFSRSWNMKRVRLLFLESIGYDKAFVEKHLEILGDKFRGRYGDNPLYWSLWKK